MIDANFLALPESALPLKQGLPYQKSWENSRVKGIGGIRAEMPFFFSPGDTFGLRKSQIFARSLRASGCMYIKIQEKYQSSHIGMIFSLGTGWGRYVEIAKAVIVR